MATICSVSSYFKFSSAALVVGKILIFRYLQQHHLQKNSENYLLIYNHIQRQVDHRLQYNHHNHFYIHNCFGHFWKKISIKCVIIIWIMRFLKIVRIIRIVFAIFVIICKRNKIDNCLIILLKAFLSQPNLAYFYTTTQIMMLLITTAYFFLALNYQGKFLYITLNMNLSS